jgi:hypothetical protein
MIGGSARASWGEHVTTGDTMTPDIKANVVNFWAGLEELTPSYMLGLQYGYQSVVANDPTQKTFSRSGTRWLVSGKLKISGDEQGIWLGGAYGDAVGSTTTLQDKTFLVTVDFGPPAAAGLFGDILKKSN